MIRPDDLPDHFRRRMAGLLGADVEPFLRALAAPAAGLRVNTLRLAPDQLRALAPWALEPLPFPSEGFRVPDDARPGRHPYHDAGAFYLQDPGAMAVGALLDPRPGERVLDLAAAPGGKATHLAARMEDRGLLVANDVSAARARELASNLERCGVTSAVVTSETPERLADRWGAYFDRVLLDAPCSGESMFHKSEAARADWSPAAVLGCARRQGDALREAARLIRPGGTLVYSTCTFSPEENERVIAEFLAADREWEPAELPAVPGAEPARADWLPPELAGVDVTRALRLWPHRVAGAGHFVAAVRRVGGDPEREPAPEAPSAPRAARELLAAFLEDALPGAAASGDLLLRGPELHRLPLGTPALGGLRVVRPGWWLGALARNRFEPSHSLALGVAPAAARRTLDLAADDPAVAAYLRGETLTSSGEPGWLLVTVDGLALGWGKRVGSTVKNHYPKGLRRRG